MAVDLREETGKKYVKQKPDRRIPLEQHRISHPDDTEQFLLRASLALSTGEILLLDRANKDIKLIDKCFNCVAVLKFDTYPFDICKSNRKRSEYYVTEPEMETVHCIIAGNGRIAKYKQYRIDEECRGITCWKSGVAVSVMRVGFRGTLGLLDYDFKLKRKVWESELHKELFRAPWYLESFNGGRNIVVSDQGNHSVICLDAKTLSTIFIFEHEQLIGPRTLTMDSHDNIYVIGSNEACHNVVKISPEGKLKGIFLSRKDKLNYPSGITYNKANETILLQRNRDVPTFCVYTTLE